MLRIFLVLAAFASGRGVAQIHVDSSCLVLWQNSPLKPPNVVWDNPDSVKVDMCSGTNKYSKFAKKLFSIAFLYYILPDSLAPFGDSIQRDWHEIGPPFMDIRSGFDNLERSIGTFTMHHHTLGTSTDHPDTSVFGNKEWFIDFNDYSNIDSVVAYMRKIPGINKSLDADFESYPFFFESVIGDRSNPINSFITRPNPFTTEANLDFTLSGNAYVQLAIYDELGRLVWGDGEGSSSEKGEHSIYIDGRSLPGGTLYARISTGFGQVKTLKLVHVLP